MTSTQPSRFPGMKQLSKHIYTDGELFCDDSCIPIEIYVDGSCFDNGKPEARAGYGVYCPEDPSPNYAARLDGVQSHSRAEISAVLCAIKRAVKAGYESLVINSDSAYVVRGINKDYPRWGWEANCRAKNIDLFGQVEDAMMTVECDVVKISRNENSQADVIAKHAAKQQIGYGKRVKLIQSTRTGGTK